MSLLKRLRGNNDNEHNQPPTLSVVVIAYDMARELPRTLLSLTAAYQRPTQALNWEVIVVDNGSPVPVDEAMVKAHGANFRLLTIEEASPSPSAAVNLGVASCKGDYVCIIIDGARILSPGVFHWAEKAWQLADRALISVVGLHLGPTLQRDSTQAGYNQAVEDQLLERVCWSDDGYRLFEIACLAGSSVLGWSGPMAETNCALLSRNLYDEIGGFDEAFTSPGGGLANLDFYRRCLEGRDVQNIYLLGEGCFHQVHGGVTTGGKSTRATRFDDLKTEYREIRGFDYQVPEVSATLIGEAQPRANHLMEAGAHRSQQDKYDSGSASLEHFRAVGLGEIGKD